MFWGLDHSCLRTGLSVAFRGLSPYALLSSTLVIDHYEDEQLAVACNIGEDVAVFSKLIRRRLWRRIVGDTSRNNRINAPIPGGRAARKSYVCARRGSRSGDNKASNKSTPRLPSNWRRPPLTSVVIRSYNRASRRSIDVHCGCRVEQEGQMSWVRRRRSHHLPVNWGERWRLLSVGQCQPPDQRHCIMTRNNDWCVQMQIHT